jgi:hypothetical protein
MMPLFIGKRWQSLSNPSAMCETVSIFTPVQWEQMGTNGGNDSPTMQLVRESKEVAH